MDFTFHTADKLEKRLYELFDEIETSDEISDELWEKIADDIWAIKDNFAEMRIFIG